MPKAFRWIIGAVVAMATSGGGFFWWHAQAKPAPIHFETSAVERGKIVAKVTATGTASAVVTVQVGTQVSGRVARLDADYNSTVKKDQVLAKIDPQLFEASLESAKANELQAEGQLAQAVAQAKNAQLIYQRDQILFEKQLLAAADRDTAKTNAESAEAAVKAAQGQLAQTKAQRHQAEVNLAYTTIISPIDGTVISRSVDVGQTVAASLAAPTLFTIAQDLHQMQVDTSVAEADVGKLDQGIHAQLTVDAYPNQPFDGTVRQIRNAAQTVQNVVTYDAVLDVKNPDLKLRPGMTVNAVFVFAQRDDVIKVPNAALRFRPGPELMARLRGANSGGTGSEHGSHGNHPDGGGGGHWRSARGGGDNAGGNGGGGGNWRGGGGGGDGDGSGRRGGGGGDASGAGGGAGGGAGHEDGSANSRMVWVLRPGSELPTPVRIHIGLSDGSYTELLDGDVKEGDELVTESVNDTAAPKGQGSNNANPFRRMF
jgi:HlyD family secretion protein